MCGRSGSGFVLEFIPPETDPETWIQEQVVYLGSSRYTSRMGS